MSNRWVPYFLQMRKATATERQLNRRLEILNRWNAGENYIDLAREYGWMPHRMRWFIEVNSQEPEPPREPNPALLTRSQIKDRNTCLIEWRKAGASYRELSESFGISSENCRFIFLRGTGELERKRKHKQRMGIIGGRIWEESGIGVLGGDDWYLAAHATDEAAKQSYLEGMTDEQWLKAGLELFMVWRAEHPDIQGPLELE